MAERTNPGKRAKPTGTALDRLPRPPCAALLGFRFIAADLSAGTIQATFESGPEMLNTRGGVQGGFLTAMMDNAMGAMIVVLTEGNRSLASVDIHTQFLRPAAPGTLTCKAELVRMGNSTAFTRATLFDSAGEAVAVASQTARLIDIGSPGPERSRS